MVVNINNKKLFSANVNNILYLSSNGLDATPTDLLNNKEPIGLQFKLGKVCFFERMDQKEMTALNSEAVQNNTINRYLTQVNNILYAGAANSIFNGQQAEAWIFRDDVGALHIVTMCRHILNA